MSGAATKSGWLKRLFKTEEGKAPHELTAEGEPIEELRDEDVKPIEPGDDVVTRLRAEAEGQKAELAAARKELESLRLQLNEDGQKLARLDELEQQVRADKGRNRSRTAGGENKALKEQLAQAQSESAKLQEIVKGARDLEQQLKSELTAAQEDLQKHKQRLESVERDLETVKGNLERQVQAVRRADEQGRARDKLLKEAQDAAATAAKAEEELKKEKLALAARLEQREAAHEREKQSLRALTESAASKDKALAEAQSRITALQSDLLAARDENESVNRDIAALRARAGDGDTAEVKARLQAAARVLGMCMDATAGFVDGVFGRASELAWSRWALAGPELDAKALPPDTVMATVIAAVAALDDVRVERSSRGDGQVTIKGKGAIAGVPPFAPLLMAALLSRLGKTPVRAGRVSAGPDGEVEINLVAA